MAEDDFNIGDECGVCPRCGTPLEALGAACPNPDCPSKKKENGK